MFRKLANHRASARTDRSAEHVPRRGQSPSEVDRPVGRKVAIKGGMVRNAATRCAVLCFFRDTSQLGASLRRHGAGVVRCAAAYRAEVVGAAADQPNETYP